LLNPTIVGTKLVIHLYHCHCQICYHMFGAEVNNCCIINNLWFSWKYID